MKRAILFVSLLLLATIIFLGVTFFLGNTNVKGALQVTSTPKAIVYLNGKKIGDAPFCKCEAEDLIKTGEYSIKLIPAQGDFKPFEEKITINKSTLTVVDKEFSEGMQGSSSIISLISIPNKKDAELLVISIPSDASVFLDTNAVGATPLSLKDITPSDHNLNLTKDGYKDKSIGIKAVRGYKLTALVSLGVNPIVSSPSAQQQTTPSPSINKVVILDTPTGFLRVRAASSTASLEITRVSPGETFELMNEGNGWFQIKLADGKTGWVSNQYAKKE